jgi:hypothetical protein
MPKQGCSLARKWPRLLNQEKEQPQTAVKGSVQYNGSKGVNPVHGAFLGWLGWVYDLLRKDAAQTTG